MSGLAADARTLVDHARVEAQNHWFTYNERMPVESNVHSISDLALDFTALLFWWLAWIRLRVLAFGTPNPLAPTQSTWLAPLAAHRKVPPVSSMSSTTRTCHW